MRELGCSELHCAAGKVTSWTLTLTDLPTITENLLRNVLYNCGDRVHVKALDWEDPPEDIPTGSFEVIIASDILYDPHHPRLIVTMLEQYLKKNPDARIILEFPLHPSHTSEVADFARRMETSFVLENSGVESGRDDWDAEIEWVTYRFK